MEPGRLYGPSYAAIYGKDALHGRDCTYILINRYCYYRVMVNWHAVSSMHEDMCMYRIYVCIHMYNYKVSHQP